MEALRWANICRQRIPFYLSAQHSVQTTADMTKPASPISIDLQMNCHANYRRQSGCDAGDKNFPIKFARMERELCIGNRSNVIADELQYYSSHQPSKCFLASEQTCFCAGFPWCGDHHTTLKYKYAALSADVWARFESKVSSIEMRFKKIPRFFRAEIWWIFSSFTCAFANLSLTFQLICGDGDKLVLHSRRTNTPGMSSDWNWKL